MKRVFLWPLLMLACGIQEEHQPKRQIQFVQLTYGRLHEGSVDLGPVVQTNDGFTNCCGAIMQNMIIEGHDYADNYYLSSGKTLFRTPMNGEGGLTEVGDFEFHNTGGPLCYGNVGSAWFCLDDRLGVTSPTHSSDEWLEHKATKAIQVTSRCWLDEIPGTPKCAILHPAASGYWENGVLYFGEVSTETFEVPLTNVVALFESSYLPGTSNASQWDRAEYLQAISSEVTVSANLLFFLLDDGTVWVAGSWVPIVWTNIFDDEFLSYISLRTPKRISGIDQAKHIIASRVGICVETGNSGYLKCYGQKSVQEINLGIVVRAYAMGAKVVCGMSNSGDLKCADFVHDSHIDVAGFVDELAGLLCDRQNQYCSLMPNSGQCVKKVPYCLTYDLRSSVYDSIADRDP